MAKTNDGIRYIKLYIKPVEDLRDTLTVEQIGRVILAICEYARTEKEPSGLDQETQNGFDHLRGSVDDGIARFSAWEQKQARQYAEKYGYTKKED